MLTLLLLLAAPLPGQARLPEDPAPAVVDPDDPEAPIRLEAWPEPEDPKALRTELGRLRKARTEEMGEEARLALIELGDAAGPQLIDALGRERSPEARERIEAVLDAVTDARHTRLLAEHFEARGLAVRTWCLRRVAGLPDAGVREQAEAALRAAEGRKRDRDAEEVWAAAACATSTGSLAGLELLIEDSRENWKRHGELAHLALTQVRGPEATRRVAKLLEGDRAEKVTGLRLLAACGDAEEAVPLVRPLLDQTDNSLLVGAINALRGIVDGEPPLGRLSTFEAIERAQKWKARL